MSKKTALTELIEKWESELGSYIPNAPIYKAFIEDAKTFIKKEKQQIVDAVSAGFGISCFETGTSCEQYYNETYKLD